MCASLHSEFLGLKGYYDVVRNLTSCFGLSTDSAVVVSALVVSALHKSGLNMDVPALSYIYAAYGKSGLISNGKE
jgi:hypothetical protein